LVKKGSDFMGEEQIYAMDKNMNLEETLSKTQIKKDIEENLSKSIEEKQNLVLYGTTVPASSLGQNGDVYFQISG